MLKNFLLREEKLNSYNFIVHVSFYVFSSFVLNNEAKKLFARKHKWELLGQRRKLCRSREIVRGCENTERS